MRHFYNNRRFHNHVNRYTHKQQLHLVWSTRSSSPWTSLVVSTPAHSASTSSSPSTSAQATTSHLFSQGSLAVSPQVLFSHPLCCLHLDRSSTQQAMCTQYAAQSSSSVRRSGSNRILLRHVCRCTVGWRGCCLFSRCSAYLWIKQS